MLERLAAVHVHWCSVVLCVIVTAAARHTCINGECGTQEGEHSLLCHSNHCKHDVLLRRPAKQSATGYFVKVPTAVQFGWQCVAPLLRWTALAACLPTLCRTQPTTVWEFWHLHDRGCLHMLGKNCSACCVLSPCSTT